MNHVIRAAAGLVLAAASMIAVAGQAAAQNFPFGSHRQTYFAGALRPSDSQATLDARTRAFYDVWKARYLRAGCAAGQYYVKADTDSGAMVVSEGQGYGMLIVAMMAGHDPQARTIFNGLHRYNLAHPSENDPNLTAWAQDTECRNVMGATSATDGDMDMAYALLLAHRQWGSDGSIAYRNAAVRKIRAILAKNVTPSTKLLNLGDWAGTSTTSYRYATRSSDWMPDHFRAFARRVDTAWTPVLDAHLALVADMQARFAAETGLLPDFVVSTNTTPRPASAGFLESPRDGMYNYNACRDPWRIGIDAALSGDVRSRAAVRRISRFFRAATDKLPDRVRDGYSLAGEALVEYQTMTFVAPLAVAALSESDTSQVWLNRLWKAMVAAEPQGYYPDSIKLLSMLAVSRNWLAP